MNIDIGPYLSRPDSEDCKCDVHGLKVKKVRYKQLADKKCRLHDDLIKVNHERTNLTSFMLDNDCNVEEIMKSVYQTDYKKKGWLVTQYKLLVAAMDSPIGLSIMPTIDLKDAYKDLTRFRYLTIENLKTQPFKTINVLNDKQETCSFWDESFKECSEYMDTISKMGLANIKNQQQYLEPLSVFRKSDDCTFLTKHNIQK